MRKLIKIALVALATRVFWRWRNRRRAEAELEAGEAPAPVPPDPAAELRQKLAETRAEDEPAAASEANVEDRRADVHEQGRAALDQMNSTDED